VNGTTHIDGGDSSTCPFSILALDGGGIRGMFSAAVLAFFEDDVGIRIADHFDLIVGTSTGAIIALSLGAGMRPAEIVELYAQGKDEIFPPARRRGLGKARSLLRSRYRADGLEAALRAAFGDKLLCDSTVPLVIPSFDLGRRAVHVFKTPHHERLRRDWRVPMVDVALAATAAPTFFPAHNLPDEHVRLIDGGIWAANPSTVAVTEAVSLFGQPLDNIKLLNIGTITSDAVRARHLDTGGLLSWIRSPNVVDVLMAGQALGAFNQAAHLIGTDNAFRLDASAPDHLVRLDSADPRELLAAAAADSRHFAPTFDTHFAHHVRHEYRPHKTREDLNA
jgi:patatin-like phospholipase/acyl hydrolase